MPDFDVQGFVQAFGYVGVATIIFLKSGLIVGFLLPGSGLLFTAGVLAGQGLFDLRILCALCTVAAVTGDSGGYALGQWLGPRLFNRKASFWWNPKHLERARAFYERHGGKTILLARFIPVIRTFAPAVAGAASMKLGVFMAYNVLGGVLWCVGVPSLGYFLGSILPDAEEHLVPVSLLLYALLWARGAIKASRLARSAAGRAEARPAP